MQGSGGVGVLVNVGVRTTVQVGVAVMTVVQVEVGEDGVGELVAVPVQVAVADPLVEVLVGAGGVKVSVINWVGVEVKVDEAPAAVGVKVLVGYPVGVQDGVGVAEPVGTGVGLRVPVNVEVAVLPAGSGQVAQGPWEIRDLHPTNEKAASRRSMVPVI